MKHFIDISNFQLKKLDSIIKTAKQIKRNPKAFSNKCKNKTLGMIFQKDSTRTRASFTVGFQNTSRQSHLSLCAPQDSADQTLTTSPKK